MSLLDDVHAIRAEIAAIHEAHGCVPGVCGCKCGCQADAGCSVNPSDLCMMCGLWDLRGDVDHGLPFPWRAALWHLSNRADVETAEPAQEAPK